MRAGDGDDQVIVTTPTDDRLTGGSGADLLRTDAGVDQLFGEAGADTLQGGTENDTLDGGAEADVLSGGTGSDVVSYRQRTEPIVVKLNNLADDGSALDGSGVRDNVRADVERISAAPTATS